MRKAGLVLTVGVLVGGFALPAWAHNFAGSGDCDGWTLNLDGDWGAVEIRVDGVSVGLAQQVFIPDTSDTTSRTFVVVWDKPRGQSDVTVTHTLQRQGNCGTTTTTTVPETTTTTEEETTTTTVVEETTTTVGESTTTVEDTTTTVVDPTTTVVDDPTTTADPVTTTSQNVIAPAGDDSSTNGDELPYTGTPTGLLLGLAGSLVASGGFLLRKVRGS